MSDDRRIAARVPLVNVSCRVQPKSLVATVALVNLSPGGACVAIDDAVGRAAHELIDAWIAGSPIRVYLDGLEPSALLVWARGPIEGRLLFGVQFARPLDEFAELIRILTGR